MYWKFAREKIYDQSLSNFHKINRVRNLDTQSDGRQRVRVRPRRCRVKVKNSADGLPGITFTNLKPIMSLLLLLLF